VLLTDFFTSNKIIMATKYSNAPEINAGSMADIAFLLLIFFLVTTTISEDKGILVKLPAIIDVPPPISDVNKRNIMNIMINSQNVVSLRNENTEIKNIKSRVKEFITNPLQNPDLAIKPDKAIVSLKNDRGTKYDTYIFVYNEIKAAYHELWEEAAKRKFDKNFLELSLSRQKEIKDLIPMLISESEPTAFGDEM
jgi:biopolymer transport protein ExbD